jgi:phosphate transport system permease protein
MEAVEMRSDVAVIKRSLIRAAEDEEINLNKRMRPGEALIRALLLLCAIVSIFTTLGIVYVLGEESLQFFSARAFVLAKAPVAEATSAIQLSESIGDTDRVLTVAAEDDRIPLADGQFIKIGDEVMRVLERGRRTILVDRAQDGTAAVNHASNTPIFSIKEERINPVETLTPETTFIKLLSGYSREFQAGDSIQIDLEIMRVVEVLSDGLMVERGVDNTTPAAHETDKSILLAHPVTVSEFLTHTTWQPQIGEFGILPLITATLITSIIGLLVAIPLGLATAIYLSEYAPRNVRNTIKPILEILAGIPTVVYGFFALTFMTPLLQDVFGSNRVEYYNMLSPGLVMGILIIPLISSMSEDALSAVPRSLREASYGLGATRLETTLNVVLPAAVSGILAAFIIGASRAVGETMIMALAVGAGPSFTFNVFSGAETMTAHIARISKGDLSRGSIDYESIFVIGLTLFVMTLVLNIISGYVSRRLREKY